jgi:nickel superoxide dismutase
MSFRNRLVLFAMSTLLVGVMSAKAMAHCQVPCGIYDDPARFTALKEHVTTIEKSMKLINELSAENDKNYNQIVRWVNNKETHANEFTEIVTYYFLAQRIKPADRADKAAMSKYLRELTLLHEMIVHAMKCKQTTDAEHCAKLRELIKAFEASYMGSTARAGNAHYHHVAGHKHDHHDHDHHDHEHP